MDWFKPNTFRVILASFLAVMLMGVVGISQAPNNPDTLVVDTISQPETLDPSWSFFTADSAIIKQIYENLIDYEGGSTGDFLPEIATSVPSVENGGISADLLTYRFDMRDDATFWDGSAVTCADAEYSFERTLAMDRSGGPTFLLLPFLTGSGSTRDSDGNVAEGIAEAITNSISCDGNTLVFQLVSVFPVEGFFSLMSGANFGPIYSKAFAIANGAADNADPAAFLAAANNPAQPADTELFSVAMGSGPYQLVDWDQAAEQVILTRYDDYLDGAGVLAALPVPPQITFVDQSVQPIEFDLDAAEAAFKASECGDSGLSVWDTGFNFTAVFNEGNARRQAALQQLEFNIEILNSRRAGFPAFNIDVISQPGPVVLNGVFQSQTLPMFVFGWSPDFIDIDNWIRQWMDAEVGTWAAFTGLSNIPESAEWTDLLNQGVSATDPAVRTAIYSQLYNDYVNFAVAITMPNRSLDNVERTWVNGNYYNPAGGGPQQPPDVYALSKIAGGEANITELTPYNPVISEF